MSGTPLRTPAAGHPSRPFDGVVVGAGVSGLLAAARLNAAGWQVAVLDKGRVVGGRLATRTFEGGRFDYGAQTFTARTPGFQALVQDWREAAVVEVSPHAGLDTDGAAAQAVPRFHGRTGMRSIAEHAARGLDVRTGTAVTAVAFAEGAWRLRCDDGSTVAARTVVLTPPVPQSLALLEAGHTRLPDDTVSTLRAITYEPCLAVLAVLDGPSGLPAPGVAERPGDDVALLADNRLKGLGTADAPVSVTIHAGLAFSREYLEDLEAGAARLVALAAPLLASPVRHYRAHRWRYSQPLAPLARPCLAVSAPGPLVLAGDAFGSGGIEGAALSGLAAAAHLVTVHDAGVASSFPHVSASSSDRTPVPGLPS